MESAAPFSTSSGPPTTTPFIPATYGRTCKNCAKAKCKCIYRSGPHDLLVCERCHRLRKPCVPSETVRKRAPRRPAPSKTAQLEEKINDLVSLLKTQQQAGVTGTSETLDSPSSSEGPSSASQNGESHKPPKHASPQDSHCPTGRSAPAPDAPSVDQEAEEGLRIFRTQFLPSFPFFHCPNDMTAQQLQKDYPLFMLAIKQITCKLFPRQLEYGERLKKLLAQKTLVDFETSLDILLAIMAYCGWAHFHKPPKPFLTVYTRLAMSQVIELGYHRHFGDISAIMSFAKPFTIMQTVPTPGHVERRAVLGCYFITSLVCTALRRADPLRWTTSLDKMLRDIESRPEYRGDSVLAALVKLQQIDEQIYTTQFHSSEAPGSSILADPKRGLPMYHVNLLRQRLRDIQGSLPPHVATSDVIEPMLHYIDYRISESALRQKPSTNTPHYSEQTKPTPSAEVNPQQLDHLQACLEAIDRFFARTLATPSARFYGMTYSSSAMIPYALFALYRLSVVYDDPLWDRREVRRRLDILSVVDKLAEKLRAVPDIYGLVPGREALTGPSPQPTNIFTKCETIFSVMRAGWEAELNKLDAPAAVMSGSVSAGLSHQNAQPIIGIPAMGLLPQQHIMNGLGMQQPHPQQQAFLPQFDLSSWMAFSTGDDSSLMDFFFN